MNTWSESLSNLALLSTRVLPQAHELLRQACLPDRDHHLHLVHLGLRPLRPQRARVSLEIFFVLRSFHLLLKYLPSDVSIRSLVHPAILLIFPGHANGTWPVMIRPTCSMSALLSMASPTLSGPALLRIQREYSGTMLKYVRWMRGKSRALRIPTARLADEKGQTRRFLTLLWIIRLKDGYERHQA